VGGAKKGGRVSRKRGKAIARENKELVNHTMEKKKKSPRALPEK